MIFDTRALDMTEWNKLVNWLNELDNPSVVVEDKTDEIMNRRFIEIGEHRVSIIFGIGSYGYRSGRLEMWDYSWEQPNGGYTANDVIEYLKELMKGD